MTRHRLGILGGTFDPIHYGHLLAAAEARWQFGLDEVRFVPTGRPWQKPQGVTDAEDRYAMTVLATAPDQGFSASRIEVDHPGPTYTVDTLRRLRDELPGGTSLFFIAGTDVAAGLATWKDPGELLELAELIVASRPGTDLDELRAAPPAAARVHAMSIPELAISSTDLRARVAKGTPISYLTPEPVVAYITKRGLYRDADVEAPGRREPDTATG
jgi:nicotinate-nucleotide adenylyltransferase